MQKTQKIQSVHMVARLFRTWNTARFCVVCYFRFLLGLNYDVNVKIWSLFSTHMPLRLEKRQKMGQLSLEFSRYSRKIEKTDFGENLHHDFFTRVIFQGHHSWPAKSTLCTKNAFVLLKSDPTINCQSKTQLNTFFISHLYHSDHF